MPFLYSTNGEVIWHHDIQHELNRSREIARFHTPDALVEFMSRDFDSALAKIAMLPNDHAKILARPYQGEANAATEAAIYERKRHMLIAMATGTGKTFMMVNEIHRLMKSGVAKRILFLVDRRALAAQAVRCRDACGEEPRHSGRLRGFEGQDDGNECGQPWQSDSGTEPECKLQGREQEGNEAGRPRNQRG